MPNLTRTAARQLARTVELRPGSDPARLEVWCLCPVCRARIAWPVPAPLNYRGSAVLRAEAIVRRQLADHLAGDGCRKPPDGKDAYAIFRRRTAAQAIR